MEGHFHTERGAGLTLIGQPDMEKMRLDNPITLPRMLSFLTHQRWDSEIRGLADFPRDRWPDNVPLLYYAYHVMAGLGSLFIGVAGLAAFLLWRGKLYESRGTLWLLMLMFPLPFVANTAGWFTAELGRQPWLVYGVLRTADSVSPVPSGSLLFSILLFVLVYGIVFGAGIYYIAKLVQRGPGETPPVPEEGEADLSHRPMAAAGNP